MPCDRPAGKGLTSWLSFVISDFEVDTFPLVSCVRFGAGLYRFLIFSLFHTLTFHPRPLFLTTYMNLKIDFSEITGLFGFGVFSR